MATVLTHALVGAALGQGAPRMWRRNWRFWAAAVLCSTAPDVDVVGFRFGIHYGDVWGHRGITHSILFAAGCGILLSIFFADDWRQRWKLGLLFFLITASHGALDALTNGGLGVAFFSPFDLRRYFFPWRPIQVSPFAAERLLSGRGMRVLWSEILWVWLPASIVGTLLYVSRHSRATQRDLPCSSQNGIGSGA